VALAKRAGVNRVLMGLPSWPNHAQIFADLGVELKGFNHAGKDGKVDMDALRAAIAEAQPGDAVLLSPACASLDMYRHYGERADAFRHAAHDLALAAGVTLEVLT